MAETGVPSITPPAPDRRAWRTEFLGLAREIVRRDRQCHRFSVAYDTAAVIADAMEMAFRKGAGLARGRAPARPAEPGPRTVPWDGIPKASRAVFWTIGIFALGRGPAEIRPAMLLLRPTGRGHSWFLSIGDEPVQHGVFRPAAIDRLVRLGLLCADHGGAGLVVTEAGRATWWAAVALIPGLFPQFTQLMPQAAAAGPLSPDAEDHDVRQDDEPAPAVDEQDGHGDDRPSVR